MISNSLQSRNAVDTMVEKAEVSSEVWVSEGSRSTANQMIEKLHDKSGYLLETKAVSMTSEQENNSQELEMVGPLSDHLEKLHQDFTLSYSQFQLSTFFQASPLFSLKNLRNTPTPHSFFLFAPVFLCWFFRHDHKNPSASFSPPLQHSHTLSL